VELDGELDPDEYCQQRGPDAYRERLVQAKGYFFWLADRARARHDVRTTEGVVAVLQSLVPAVQRISDRMERMAVAENLAGYIGVERGIVLDSFRKTIGDRQEKTIERPPETIRADEKGLIHVLLSEVEGRESLLAELERVEILARFPTRHIFQAVSAVHAGGDSVTFDAVNARLAEADRALLAQILFSEEVESHEMDKAYGARCLESLQRSEEQLRRSELKAQVKQAERSGDVREALRLAQELAELERRNPARA
jgi:DNA primase